MEKIFYAMLIAVFALPVSAQRMLDVSNRTFSTAMTAPTVERTVTPTENGYRVKYSFEKAALIPDDLFSGCERWHLCFHAPGVVPVVYDLSDFTPMKKAPAASENQVVEEGKIWRYHSDFNGNMTPEWDIYVDVSLSGTTEIDGKEYLNCYVWKTENEFSKESAALIAYMREEGGKVYVRYVPDAEIIAMEKGISIIPYAPILNHFVHDWVDLCKSDILIFDSNLAVGDVLRSSEDNAICEKFTVKSIDEVECLGKTYKRQRLCCDGWNDFYSFYEGIGDTIGLLPLPGAFPVTYGECHWCLAEVLDNNGNVIFAPSKIVSGVDGVSDEANVISETYRDLNGIEVAGPTQSGVYLKTQLLDNGKTRTEKVIIR